MTQATDWDFHYDVVVVGSGAGGMTAALIAKDLGLDALVIEKSELVGGTTAVSGGAIWIPDNPQMQAIGYADSIDEALTYLQETIGPDYDETKSRAYVETGPALVRYLAKHSQITFAAGPLPDYYADLPGGKDKYRALDPQPIHARDVGDDIQFVRPPHPQTRVGGTMFTTGEVATILRKDAGWLTLTMKRLVRHLIDVYAYPNPNKLSRLTLGNALISRCLLSLRQRNIPLWRETGLKTLVSGDTGVVGIVAEQDGREIRIQARRGVILAAGGFGSNPEMRKTHVTRSPNPARSVAPDTNQGDAITEGMRLGAATNLLEEAWWIPTYRLEETKLTSGMFFDRAFPGSIIVNRFGERYMDETANYDDTGRAMANATPTNDADAPSYMIFDARYRRNYIAGPLQPMPGFMDAFLPDEVKQLLVKAASLTELADKLGIDSAVLQHTVERFNGFARDGVDLDFHRGEETYERHYSDPKMQPNSTMAPIAEAPFYAMRIHTGDIGTKGGLVTDQDGRVQHADGTVIPGLYAIGSSAASMMGRTYPGGGITIGPAMVFGARAAMQIAGKGLPD